MKESRARRAIRGARKAAESKRALQNTFAEPDWSAGLRMRGGEGKELYAIPKPWILRWPNDKGIRRDVDAQITSWRGISLGASHFYAEIKVEEQQIWDPNEVCWRGFDGRNHQVFAKEKFHADVLTRAAAVSFIEAVIRALFMGPEYRLVSSAYLDGDSGEVGLQVLLKHLRRERG